MNEEEKKSSNLNTQRIRQNFIVGDYSRPEFESITRWEIDEKIDGTNIRVIWEPENVSSPEFRGRTDNAELPRELLLYLQKTFTREKLLEHFPEARKIIFFGEGYGPKIQAPGSRYRSDQSFIMFDVVINGVWLRKEDVIDVATKFGIQHTIGQQIMTTQKVIEFVMNRPHSYVAEDDTLVMEGVVARAYPMMLFRDSMTPIMFKLRVEDLIKNTTAQNKTNQC